jgi:P4 family phage/plasmid primase-like protien
VSGSQAGVQLENALWALQRGFRVFPCQFAEKKPNTFLVPNGVLDSTTDEKIVRQWWKTSPNGNPGIHGGVIVDVDEGLGSFSEVEAWREKMGLPPTLAVRTGRRSSYGVQYHYSGETNSSPYEADGVSGEVRSGNLYGMAPGSIHPETGKAYEVIADLPIAPFPISCLLERLREKTIKRLNKAPSKLKGGEKIKRSFRQYWLVSQCGRLRNTGLHGEALFRTLCTLKDEYCEHPEEKTDAMLRQICESGEKNYGVNVPDQEPERKLGNEGTSNGLRFAEQHGDKARYWPERKKWIVWSGQHWKDDKLRDVREMAKQTARSIYAEAANISDDKQRDARVRWANQTLQMNGIRDMLESASSLQQMKVATEQIDSNHYLLNFLNGTVDLRTGELREHRQEDYITKLAQCGYSPETISPLWLYYVKQTFGGEEMADWIQKVVGYSLTGITSEKAYFMLIGPTDVGKSTFLGILRTIFSEYSVRIRVESLMQTKGNSNNTDADLADLRGARLAITSETNEGQWFSEAKLKQITQGMGTIKAVRKYEAPIEFPETHHLFMDCNHKPGITGTDDATWNRLVPIPCEHRLKPEEIDRSLRDKLLREAEGIAAWAVTGAVRWTKEGLAPLPEIVKKFRDEWRNDADTVGAFIEECCKTGANEKEEAGLLYLAFESWATDHGQFVFSGTAFGNRLTERGFTKRRGHVPERLGIALLSEWANKAETKRAARTKYGK